MTILPHPYLMFVGFILVDVFETVSIYAYFFFMSSKVS